MRRFLKGFLEGGVASFFYGIKIWSLYLKRDWVTAKETKKAINDKQIKFIFPPKKLNLWPNTVNRAKLIFAFEDGKRAGKELLKEFN